MRINFSNQNHRLKVENQCLIEGDIQKCKKVYWVGSIEFNSHK